MDSLPWGKVNIAEKRLRQPLSSTAFFRLDPDHYLTTYNAYSRFALYDKDLNLVDSCTYYSPITTQTTPEKVLENYYFYCSAVLIKPVGMKAHIGVDAKSGLTHSLVTTAANEHDLNQVGKLLHGDEEFISADAGYQGAEKRDELSDVSADWLIAKRPGKVNALKQHPRKNKLAIRYEYLKASIRAKVEHPFRIVKCQFGFVKARYKGLAKNDSQLAMLFTLANLVRVDQLIRAQARST